MTYRGDQPPPPSHRRPPRGPRQHQGAQMMPLPGAPQAPRRPPQPPPGRGGYGQRPPFDEFDRHDHRPPRGGPPPYDEPPGTPPGGSPYPEQPPPRKRKKRMTFGKVLTIFLLVIVLAIAGIWLYLDFSINRIAALPDYEGKPAAAAGTNWLIVGSDSRAGLDAEAKKRLVTGDADGQRTDTIMLAHIPDNDTAPTLLSIPRDSVVEIPGYGASKINAAFSHGGAPLLAQTIEQNTGLRIDHYAEIGFGGFANIVDALGGVEMNIPEEMHDPKTGITIPAGKQELDGAQALGFVRMRYSSATPRSDLDRVVNQRKFIGAMAGEMASPGTLLNPFTAFPLLAEAPDALTMDEEDHLHHLFGLAWAMRGISDGGTVTTTMPTTSGSAESWDEELSGQLLDALKNDTPIPDSAIVN